MSSAEYQRKWYAAHREQVLIARRAKYALEPKPEIRAAARVEQSKRNAARVRADYRTRIDTIKAAPCMDCGGTFPPECMDFDHRDPNQKLFGIGTSGQRRWSMVEAEIAKCDLVCANCHRIRTRRALL